MGEKTTTEEEHPAPAEENEPVDVKLPSGTFSQRGVEKRGGVK